MCPNTFKDRWHHLSTWCSPWTDQLAIDQPSAAGLVRGNGDTRGRASSYRRRRSRERFRLPRPWIQTRATTAGESMGSRDRRLIDTGLCPRRVVHASPPAAVGSRPSVRPAGSDVRNTRARERGVEGARCYRAEKQCDARALYRTIGRERKREKKNNTRVVFYVPRRRTSRVRAAATAGSYG